MIVKEEIQLEDHLGLVGKVVAKFVPRGTKIDECDEWSDGVMGLISAKNGFKPELGFKFSTYAVKCIRTAIINGHRHRVAKKNKVKCVQLSVDVIDQKENRVNEVDAVDSVNDIWFAIKDKRAKISDDRIEYILKRRLIDGVLLREVGAELHLTRERVRQLQDEGIEAIKDMYS